MREGNLQRLEQCLQENQFRFIQAGTFLLVEKLKTFVHRRLLKRVALLHKAQEPAKAERLPLGKLMFLVQPHVETIHLQHTCAVVNRSSSWANFMQDI